MKYALSFSVALLSILLTSSAAAQTPRQDAAELRLAVENFLHMQTSDLNGKVNIVVGQVDARLNLAACPAAEPFLPAGSRAWGKTTVGVRCLAPTPWTVYI